MGEKPTPLGVESQLKHKTLAIEFILCYTFPMQEEH